MWCNSYYGVVIPNPTVGWQPNYLHVEKVGKCASPALSLGSLRVRLVDDMDGHWAQNASLDEKDLKDM
jgi:hypothetical protein